MTRTIDTLAQPKTPTEMKVLVLSYPRNGTMGLYKAFQILGYNPYHLITAFTEGAEQCKIIREGLEAQYEGKGRPYGREEFDKWMGDHNVILDMSAFFAEALVKAYPDAKVVLSHRNPESWMRSVHNTFLPLERAKRRFPMFYMQYLDPFTNQMYKLTRVFTRLLWGTESRDLRDWTDEAAMKKYREHNEMVKRIVPTDRLLVVQLEDGLGWEQLCPFLGVDIPDQPYPRANDPNEFRKMWHSVTWLHWRRSLAAWAAVVIPAISAGVWYLRQGR